jgi:hypothetical protein
MTLEQLRARHRAYLVSGAIILAFAVLVFETAAEPLIERVMFLQTETLLVLMTWRQTAWVSFLRMMDRDTGPAQGTRGGVQTCAGKWREERSKQGNESA